MIRQGRLLAPIEQVLTGNLVIDSYARTEFAESEIFLHVCHPFLDAHVQFPDQGLSALSNPSSKGITGSPCMFFMTILN